MTLSIGTWFDYSSGRPSGVALKAAGATGVLRYAGLGAADKRITAAEYADLTAAGLQVLFVAELGTSDSWGTSADDDYARGRANALATLADLQAAGVSPDKQFIAAASDAHVSAQWQVTDAVRYVSAFRDVFGPKAGHYGFSDTQLAVHAAGVASWFWRCGSAPTEPWVHFWQRNAGLTATSVSGVACDINEQYLPISYPVAAIVSTEDSMYTGQLDPGDGVRACIAIPMDRLVRVTLAADADVSITEYGWVPPGGGNGFTEAYTLPDHGAHSFSPPKGTGKIDFLYSSTTPIQYVVDVIG
jgi:Domain of unknown function (DUF1906)